MRKHSWSLNFLLEGQGSYQKTAGIIINTIINSWDTGQQLGGAAKVERKSGKLKERVFSGYLGFTSLEETDYILLAA